MAQSSNDTNDEDFQVDKLTLLTASQGHSLHLGKTIKSHRKAEEKEEK